MFAHSESSTERIARQRGDHEESIYYSNPVSLLKRLQGRIAVKDLVGKNQTSPISFPLESWMSFEDS